MDDSLDVGTPLLLAGASGLAIVFLYRTAFLAPGFNAVTGSLIFRFRGSSVNRRNRSMHVGDFDIRPGADTGLWNATLTIPDSVHDPPRYAFEDVFRLPAVSDSTLSIKLKLPK